MAGLSVSASADDYAYAINGYGDFRLVYPSDTDGFLDGGAGKTRWGDEAGATRLKPELGAMVLRGIYIADPSLRLTAELRYDTQQKTALDVLDAYFRFRPVSLSRWRWSVKGGAFFPPVSLENTEIGWTSPWTLTPSAINSWVGDELRIIGAEGLLEWRGDVDYLAASGGLFALNQPAGVAIAQRGWTFDDQPVGLLDHVRLPDAIAAARAGPEQPYNPLYAEEFQQVDGNPGWYGSVSWERPDYGRLTALYYDNNADPSAVNATAAAWHTKFWSGGATTQIGNVVLIAQALTGSTAIHPPGFTLLATDFRAAFLLAGWQRRNWRYALRADLFSTSNNTGGAPPSGGEHGQALTAAISWKPYRWLRLTSELIHIDSWRPQRVLDDNGAPAVRETQVQMAARFSF
jgi:hypothetical protein